jgi:hypothetical protein
MTRFKPFSATALAVGGGVLALLGLYFAFLRPALLPEDLRSLGASRSMIESTFPGLAVWLRRVFLAMGGYIFASGILTVSVAATSFRSRARYAVLVVTAAGLSSIGLMVVVNFLIASDFKWLLLAFTLPWPVALVLYRFEQSRGPVAASSASESAARVER